MEQKVFEAEGEKQISTPYAHIYILLATASAIAIPAAASAIPAATVAAAAAAARAAAAETMPPGLEQAGGRRLQTQP